VYDIKKLLNSKDINDVTPLAHFQAQLHYIEFIQFNDSGSLLITSSYEGFTLNIWKIENHFEKKALALTCLYKLKRGKTSARIENVIFSTDSRWVCVFSNHGTAHLYYIDPYGVEQMYKRNEVMKQYSDIPISNINSYNYKNIRSKSINDMVNTNLISPPQPKIPSPLSSPVNESPPNTYSKSLQPLNERSSSFEFVSSSSSLNINSIKQSNYSMMGRSYHSVNSDYDFGNLSTSFKSNSYSSSNNNSYMNYFNLSNYANNSNSNSNKNNSNTNNNSNNSNNSNKPVQSYALSRIKYKKCSFYYVDTNQASHAVTSNMNYKSNEDAKLSSMNSINDTVSYNSINSMENNEFIYANFYSPASCGKFLNKIMISSEKKEPNEKQKIIIFRVTEDQHQGQLELYKIFGSEADDTSLNLETSPTSVSNLSTSISPRKKSFSYSPSNSISMFILKKKIIFF